MKIDLTHELRLLGGDVLKDQKNKTLTLRGILTNALLDPQQSKEIDGEEKAERFNLALEISSSKKFYELSIDDAKTVKDLVGKIFAPLIVGQVWPILEKGHHPLTKKQETDNGNPSGESNKNKENQTGD